MKKYIIYFLVGVLLGVGWGYFWDAIHAGQKWAWWPMITIFIGGGVLNLFTREKTSVKLTWLIGFLVGAILSGFFYWYFLSGSHGYYLKL